MNLYTKIILFFNFISFFNNIILSQDINDKNKIKFADYQVSSKKYVTNENGNVMMNVNIWGHVRTPGNIFVNDGIELATLLSIVGGPMKGADLKKVRLYRELPDKDGTLAYEINFEEFLSTGNRSNFIEIKPNDTVIIAQKASHYIVEQIGTLNTIFAAILVYLNIQSLSS